MEPDCTTFLAQRGLLIADPLQIAYEEGPGLPIPLREVGLPLHHRIIDARTGTVLDTGTTTFGAPVPDPLEQPRAILCTTQPGPPA